MKKLLVLATFVAAATVANVNAMATRARAAQDPEHPVTKANAQAKKAGRRVVIDDVVSKAKDAGKKEAGKKDEQGKFAQARAWLGKRTKTQVAGAVAVTAVAGLIVDAAVRKDNSLLGKLLKFVRGTKAEKQVMAEVNAQLTEVAAR